MPYGETLIKTQIKTLILTFKFFLTMRQTKVSVLSEFSVFKKSLCLCASACLNYNMEISLRRMSLCNLLLSWQFIFQIPPPQGAFLCPSFSHVLKKSKVFEVGGFTYAVFTI